LIRQTKPDIVHTHSSKAGIVGRAAAWAEHVPGVVHTVHGLPFHERQPRWVSRAYITAERWAARRCHRIIGITEAMCSEFQAHNIGRPEQFDVVPSGVDVEAFTLPPEVRPRMRQELGIPQDAAVVGIVARLDKLKGQEDLVRIMPDLLKARPDARLLIVGDGWFRPQLDALVAELNVKDRVIFAGLVPPPRVPEFIAAMDVHALPSYQEGQSRTLVQALLAGVPVVGYDAGGIKNVCLHERTGLLVPVGDQAGLCAALTRLLTDDELRTRLGRDGRTYARANYDAQVMYSKLQAIYERVLANRG
jgi:glycosyltransferase involved in cell wall biosynthesis